MMQPEKRDYFDRIASEWDALPRPEDWAARVEEFCARALPDAARRVLDVGSGTGLLLPFLRRLRPRALVAELDFSPSMLRASRTKHGDAGVVRICADALALPFPDASFDAVLCFGILPHLGPAAEALPALWRVVAPGGRLAVGHLLGSARLNEKHREIGGPVAADTLPPAAEAAGILAALGAVPLEACDEPEQYLVVVRRPGE